MRAEVGRGCSSDRWLMVLVMHSEVTRPDMRLAHISCMHRRRGTIDLVLDEGAFYYDWSRRITAVMAKDWGT